MNATSHDMNDLDSERRATERPRSLIRQLFRTYDRARMCPNVSECVHRDREHFSETTSQHGPINALTTSRASGKTVCVRAIVRSRIGILSLVRTSQILPCDQM